MSAGAFIEPLVVVTLLFGGTWFNRNTAYTLLPRNQQNRWSHEKRRRSSVASIESGLTEDALLGGGSRRSSSNSFGSPSSLDEPMWRKRDVGAFGWKKAVTSPDTRRFRHNFLSRVLVKFPFLVEAWYWALIYWVYQLGRAFSAVTIVEGTVHVARRHALQVIALEERLHLFHELEIQAFFLQHETLMHWINRIYSFIHIPGTIFFLVWLFYYTTTRNRLGEKQENKEIGEVDGSPAGPMLFEARRRTMATCNLLAFIVFTAWPCMPPRLLSDSTVKGPSGIMARQYGFVDTVHGTNGEASVWTANRFCNQYAAMPSLHFGYALMIGLTIAFLPLAPQHRRSRTVCLPLLGRICRVPSWRRTLCVFLGFSYAFTILVAIISTANHFILDAVAGACVCGLGWWRNEMLLNLLPVEDYFLWCVRIEKPSRRVVDVDELGVVGKGVVDS